MADIFAATCTGKTAIANLERRLSCHYKLASLKEVHKSTQRIRVHGRRNGVCTPQRSKVPQQQYELLIWHAGRHNME